LEVVAVARPESDDPEWTDFQPVLDPEISIDKFKAARKRAKVRVRTKQQVKKETAKPVSAIVRQQS
jgi:hypothetical protein